VHLAATVALYVTDRSYSFCCYLLIVCAIWLTMPKDKGPEWNHVIVIDDRSTKGTAYVTMQCLYCDKTYSGGVNHIRAHVVGGDTSISKCDKAPQEAVDAMKAINKEKAVRDREKKKRDELDKLTKSKGAGTAGNQSQSCQKPLTQTSIVASFQATAKAEADAAVAKFFYANGIPFSNVESKYLKGALVAVATVVHRLNKASAHVRENLRAAAQTASNWYNRNAKPKSFNVGDSVRVYIPRKQTGKTPKWQSFFRTEGRIERKINDATYIVSSPKWRDNRIIHVDKIKLITIFPCSDCNSVCVSCCQIGHATGPDDPSACGTVLGFRLLGKRRVVQRSQRTNHINDMYSYITS